MIKMSIQNGIFPSKLKIAKIVPVFKSGDETDPDNYRPISLICCQYLIEFLRKLCIVD